MSEPVVTEQEIDKQLSDPLLRMLLVGSWHRMMHAQKWLSAGLDKPSPPGGMTIAIPEIGKSAYYERPPTETELREWVRSVTLRRRLEAAEEREDERRERECAQKLRETRALLGRTT